MSAPEQDCTVVVTSCDAYRDVDGPFIRLWRRYWPDCPFETVLLTETPPPPPPSEDEPRFDRTIATGPGKTWSEMLVEALDGIDTRFVILTMNDFLLESRVDTTRILELLAVADSARALNLRLIPNPPGRTPSAWPGLLAFPYNRAYSASCQTGFWDREFLRSLATRTRSAWEFERYGSYMFEAGETRPLLVTERKEIPCLDSVHKGYWEKSGVELLRREGIEYDFSRRGRPPWPVRLKELAKKLLFNLNPEIVTRVQNVFNAGKK